MAIDGRPAIDPGSPAYFFDLAPVLARCEGLRRNPERATLMCRNHVRQRAPGELMIPRDNGFFLVVQTCSGAAADTVARDISLTLLELFFGADCFEEIPALFRPVTHVEMVAAGVGVTARPGRSPDTSTNPSVPTPTRLAAPSKPEIFAGLEFGFLPMLNLQNEAVSVYMCGIVSRREERTVFGADALAGCEPKVRPWLDMAALDHSLDLLGRIEPAKFAAAICTPVSFETMAWSRGRQLYQQALQSAGVADNPFLIVRIEDVPPGIPAARLAEIVAMVRPFVKRVFLHLPDMPAVTALGGHIGAAAFCMTLPTNASPPAVVRIATGLVRVSAMQQALPCVTGATPGMRPLLRAAGVRFAAGAHDDFLRQEGIFPECVAVEDFAA